MAVLQTTTFTVKPDNYEEFLDLNRKARTIIERPGARTAASASLWLRARPREGSWGPSRPMTLLSMVRCWTSSSPILKHRL